MIKTQPSWSIQEELKFLEARSSAYSLMMYTAASAFDSSSLTLLSMSLEPVPEDSATALACHLELCEECNFIWPFIHNLQPSLAVSSEKFFQLGEPPPPRRNNARSAEKKDLLLETETRDTEVTRETCASAVSADLRQFKVSLIEADGIDKGPILSSIVLELNLL